MSSINLMKMRDKEIVPAILAKDLTEFEKKIRLVEGFVDFVQVDIMDGSFVENVSISLEEIASIETSLNIEVHLMVNDPIKYIFECGKFPCFKRVFFHLEAVIDPSEVLEEMSKHDFEKGIAINPDSDVLETVAFEDKIDTLLLLSVNPGFSGQEFIPETISKIKKARKIFNNLIIEVDGGVKEKNIKEIFEVGAKRVVVGSGLFDSDDIKKQYQKLQALASD